MFKNESNTYDSSSCASNAHNQAACAQGRASAVIGSATAALATAAAQICTSSSDLRSLFRCHMQRRVPHCTASPAWLAAQAERRATRRAHMTNLRVGNSGSLHMSLCLPCALHYYKAANTAHRLGQPRKQSIEPCGARIGEGVALQPARVVRQDARHRHLIQLQRECCGGRRTLWTPAVSKSKRRRKL